jgi:hypothetical protein
VAVQDSYAARPAYPFKDTLPTGLARHHIIPYQDLLSFCHVYFDHNQERLKKLFNAFPSNISDYLNSNALGVYGTDMHALLTALITNPGDVEANEALDSLLAWLPNNLVVGPNNRLDDPGNRYNATANYNAVEYISGVRPGDQRTLQIYETLQSQWYVNGADDVRENIVLFFAGGTAPLYHPEPAQCWSSCYIKLLTNQK